MSRKYKNSVIIDEDSVLKNRNEELLKLYEYFELCGFNNYPKVIDVDDKYIRTKYEENNKYHETTKGIELIKTVAVLHNKTSFYKEISLNKHKEVYEKILGNIEYLKEYYEEIISDIESEIYMSPSHYLFARNYSVIIGSLKYASDNLKNWYSIVKEKKEERVCIVHNNLKLEHFIKNDNNYLISFDNHIVDSPVIDLYKFYKSEGYKLNFKLLLTEYNNIFSLLPEEEKLLKILLSIPPKIIFKNDEIENLINIRTNLKYIYDSYEIVK